jgi:hypothetical protein
MITEIKSEHFEYANDRALRMFGYFRKAEANDPKAFAAAIVLRLAQYPKEVIDEITDPLTGLASKFDYPPSVRQLREACEEEMRRQHPFLSPTSLARLKAAAPN